MYNSKTIAQRVATLLKIKPSPLPPYIGATGITIESSVSTIIALLSPV